MFILEDGREHLYQWDIDRRLQVEDATITEVHFCNKTDDCSLVVKTYTDDTYDGKVYADIPNILLQETWDIRVYAYCGGKYTKVEDRFKVKARTKPADYVYTETEVVNYETLLNKLESIEENIGQAVEDYLYENPIEAGATDEQVAQINRNTEDIADIDREIADLPTKEYVDNAVKNVEVDLTGYATEKYVNDKVANIDVDVDLDGYATENWVLQKGYISNIPSEYVTETELTAKGYATETFVNDAIANIDIPEGGGGSADLSNYYTKEETDSAIYNSKDAYYVALTNIPVGEENAILASDELTEFATRFVADRNVCLHIQETGNDTTRGFMSATITYIAGTISFTCSVIDPINIRDNSANIYYSYKLKKNANSEWTIYKDLIGQFAITTKQYVDNAIYDSKDAYYLDFSSATVEPQDADAEMIAFATHWTDSNNNNLCVHIKEAQGVGSISGWQPAVFNFRGNTFTINEAVMSPAIIANNGTQSFVTYKLTYQEDKWVYYMEAPYNITLATKDYVTTAINDALAGIATAEGGSY